jgi:hypothetical protein
VAERNADFLLTDLRTPDGRLHHTWKAGVAKGNGFLEDYTHLIEGLIDWDISAHLFQLPRRFFVFGFLGSVVVKHLFEATTID